MGRRPLEDKNIRKLSKVGGGKTYSVTIPIEMVQKLGWRETQKVVFELDEKQNRLVIKDWKK